MSSFVYLYSLYVCMYIWLNCIYLYLNVYCQCLMLTVCTKGLRVTQFQFSVCMYCTCGRIDNKTYLTYLIFSDIFDICRCHILTNSSQRFIRMNTKIGHCNLKPFVTLNCEDLEFSSEGVSVASCQISMFRHETGSCYNSGMLCPICTKLHMFDKTPDMKRST